MSRQSDHPLYDTWNGMVRRCRDPKARGYMYYGGKGIKVCDEWLKFKPFADWVMENLGPRAEGMTLDRTDNWGPYAPGNVRWATHEQQQANRAPPWWEWPEYAERRKAPRMHRHIEIGDGALIAVECTDPACPGPPENRAL